MLDRKRELYTRTAGNGKLYTRLAVTRCGVAVAPLPVAGDYRTNLYTGWMGKAHTKQSPLP